MGSNQTESCPPHPPSAPCLLRPPMYSFVQRSHDTSPPRRCETPSTNPAAGAASPCGHHIEYDGIDSSKPIAAWRRGGWDGPHVTNTRTHNLCLGSGVVRLPPARATLCGKTMWHMPLHMVQDVPWRATSPLPLPPASPGHSGATLLLLLLGVRPVTVRPPPRRTTLHFRWHLALRSFERMQLPGARAVGRSGAVKKGGPDWPPFGNTCRDRRTHVHVLFCASTRP